MAQSLSAGTITFSDGTGIVSVAVAGETLYVFAVALDGERRLLHLPLAEVSDSGPEKQLRISDLASVEVDAAFVKKGRAGEAFTYDLTTQLLVRLGERGRIVESIPFGGLRDIAPVGDGYVVTFVASGFKWVDRTWMETASALETSPLPNKDALVPGNEAENLASDLLATSEYDTFLVDSEFRLRRPLLEQVARSSRADAVQHSRYVLPGTLGTAAVYTRFSPQISFVGLLEGQDETQLSLEGVLASGDEYGSERFRLRSAARLADGRYVVANGRAGSAVVSIEEGRRPEVQVLDIGLDVWSVTSAGQGVVVASRHSLKGVSTIPGAEVPTAPRK
ncbi:MAG: hypothetical protein AAF690_13440 [Acidobacteriota bacterium]